ncbi:restriction endonuclease subunit S [Photobacterium leiognathi]|uniref:restriction endonuclease subunit S n=1 Tax=Photobacterium leiognathi TaxID=553611 RepID=UPI002739B442|nr:hypothetical protein [Photobacterium leiognathi]
MRSNYKKLGQFIKEVSVKNKDLSVELLLGVSITKQFIPSIANTIGTDMSKYKVVEHHQFAYGPVTSRNGDKISVALLSEEKCIVSSSYTVFEIVDTELLDSEYLMMWFKRSEFDRYARFMSHGSVRELFGWEEMCDVELPVPSIEKQREIVREYNVVNDRILLNEQLMNRLEKSTFALFEEFFPIHGHDIETDHTTLEQLVSFNPKHTIKKNSATTYVEMANVAENSMTISNPIVRPFTAGSKFKNNDTLLARITPCLENGKTAFINILGEDEIAYGSTEFIVMRSKGEISPFWIYCLAKNENFRSYAISSMVGSSGRQRVHSDYLKEYRIDTNGLEAMSDFHRLAAPMFKYIANKHQENHKLQKLRELLLQKVA